MSEIKVEVAYATPDSQRIFTVNVPVGSTIETAIDRSGVLDVFPEIDLLKQKVGIFSQPKKLSDIVFSGDRIEIYRPLTIDPKEARRKRANKK
jgi:putative ubiquitin-RnfH superfamily antitoxin RatB of RatAB toxin-antitoxin module